MPAAKLNLTVEQGVTFSKRLVWRDPKRRPVNLNGYTAKMQIRSNSTSDQVLFELSTENGRITMPGNGVIQLSISVADTFEVAGGSYDLVLFAPGDNAEQYRLIQGKVVVSPAITRE